jgi:hypothetical protein
MKMIVYWGSDDTANFQVPEEVKWEDGSPATLDDYFKNQMATQSSTYTERGSVTVIFPGVVANTHYDVLRCHWVLRDPTSTGDPMVLDETDPNASDEALNQELSSYPFQYKSTFDRSHLSRIDIVGT